MLRIRLAIAALLLAIATAPFAARAQATPTYVEVTKIGDQINVSDDLGTTYHPSIRQLLAVEIPSPFNSNLNDYSSSTPFYLHSNSQAEHRVVFYDAHDVSPLDLQQQDQATQVWFDGDGEVMLFNESAWIKVSVLSDTVHLIDNTGMEYQASASTISAVQLPEPFWSNGDAGQADTPYYLFSNHLGINAVRYYGDAQNNIVPLDSMKDRAKEVWMASNGHVRIYIAEPPAQPEPKWDLSLNCPQEAKAGDNVTCSTNIITPVLPISFFRFTRYELLLNGNLQNSNIRAGEVMTSTVGPLALGGNKVTLQVVWDHPSEPAPRVLASKTVHIETYASDWTLNILCSNEAPAGSSVTCDAYGIPRNGIESANHETRLLFNGSFVEKWRIGNVLHQQVGPLLIGANTVTVQVVKIETGNDAVVVDSKNFVITGTAHRVYLPLIQR